MSFSSSGRESTIQSSTKIYPDVYTPIKCFDDFSMYPNWSNQKYEKPVYPQPPEEMDTIYCRDIYSAMNYLDNICW